MLVFIGYGHRYTDCGIFANEICRGVLDIHSKKIQSQRNFFTTPFKRVHQEFLKIKFAEVC